MIYVGIGVAKDKHDCFITNSDGEVLFKAFTIPNNLDGFNNLYQKIESVSEDISKVKVGLEATGHSITILGCNAENKSYDNLLFYILLPKCVPKEHKPNPIFFIQIQC